MPSISWSSHGTCISWSRRRGQQRWPVFVWKILTKRKGVASDHIQIKKFAIEPLNDLMMYPFIHVIIYTIPTSPKAKFNEVVCRRPSFTRSSSSNTKSRFFTKACKSSPCPRSSHIGPAKKHHQSHQKPSKKLSRTTFKRTPVLRMRFFAVLNLPTKSFEWISFWIWC